MKLASDISTQAGMGGRFVWGMPYAVQSQPNHVSRRVGKAGAGEGFGLRRYMSSEDQDHLC